MENKLLSIIKKSLSPSVDTGLPIVLEATIEGFLGQVAAGLVVFRLSYKQKMMEENLNVALLSLFKRARKMEDRLDSLSDERRKFLEEKAFPITFDYIVDENESAKIELIVNGLESVIKEDISEETLILTYNDVMKELRVSEIQELLRFNKRDTYQYDMSRVFEALKSIGDRSEEMRKKRQQIKGYNSYVYNKLVRLGLVEMVLDGGTFDDSEPKDTGSVELTDFGYNFVDYFRINQKDKSVAH